MILKLNFQIAITIILIIYKSLPKLVGGGCGGDRGWAGWMVWGWRRAAGEWRWRLRDGARGTGKRGEPWCMCGWVSLTRPSLLGTVFFRTALLCSGGCHMESGGILLHDAVGMNCRESAATENRDSAVKYMGWGVYPDDCVCVLPDFTWLPLLGVGRK